jgi:hypothetical protein
MTAIAAMTEVEDLAFARLLASIPGAVIELRCCLASSS